MSTDVITVTVPDFLADMYLPPAGWEEYKPEIGYHKKPCMIRLKSGEEHGPCWPNAGRFVALFGSGQETEWHEDNVAAAAYFRPREDTTETTEQSKQNE